MFSKVLIANRGEIAVRVARTCRDLGVATVAVFSDADARARHVRAADEAVHLPGVAPAETYLNVGAVVGTALSSGAEAVHPGYGFLSERADAARAIGEAGLAWVGPPPHALLAAGDKVEARRLAHRAGVAPVPGTLDPVADPEEALRFGEEHGYPVAVKAAGGGGGRGFRVANAPEDVPAAWESAVREAVAYFGSEAVYLERYLPWPKHIEVQVLAPRAGEAMWLGARDCSLQRRHQKLLEETPPPRFAEVVPAMGEAAVRVANACGYVNAGTVEFLVDEDGSFYFLEINARLQVEHTITEEVFGIDLVAAQLRIAAGEDPGFAATDLEPKGHAIECRINAEDPARGFLPGPGRIVRYAEPSDPGIRVDSGFGEGDEVPQAYDSLLAKLVAWGESREEARHRMLRALEGFQIEGVPTTISAHRLLIEHPDFVNGAYTTRTVEEEILPAMRRARAGSPDGTGRTAVLMVGDEAVRLWHPAMARSVSAATRTAGRDGEAEGAAKGGAKGAKDGPTGDSRGAVTAPMHGTILEVLVREGEAVETGDAVAILEAMKMETALAAPADGRVVELSVEPGDVVEAGRVVARIA